MILVSKAEAEAIRKKFPNVHLKRTVNRYYAEEHPAVMKMLRKKGAAT